MTSERRANRQVLSAGTYLGGRREGGHGVREHEVVVGTMLELRLGQGLAAQQQRQ